MMIPGRESKESPRTHKGNGGNQFCDFELLRSSINGISALCMKRHNGQQDNHQRKDLFHYLRFFCFSISRCIF